MGVADPGLRVAYDPSDDGRRGVGGEAVDELADDLARISYLIEGFETVELDQEIVNEFGGLYKVCDSRGAPSLSWVYPSSLSFSTGTPTSWGVKWVRGTSVISNLSVPSLNTERS